RPQAALFQALRSLGYRIDSPNDKLPAVIHGSGPRPGKCQVGIEESSQFASALLLCAAVGGWQVTVSGEDSEEASYVRMTSRMVEVFPVSSGTFRIEPDASSGSYFLAADFLRVLSSESSAGVGLAGSGQESAGRYSSRSVANWPQSGLQIDEQFPRLL